MKSVNFVARLSLLIGTATAEPCKARTWFWYVGVLVTGIMQCEDCLYLYFVQSLCNCFLEFGCSGWIFLVLFLSWSHVFFSLHSTFHNLKLFNLWLFTYLFSHCAVRIVWPIRATHRYALNEGMMSSMMIKLRLQNGFSYSQDTLWGHKQINGITIGIQIRSPCVFKT